MRRIDDQLGGEMLLTLVRVTLWHVLDLLDQRRYTDTVGRRLHATAAEQAMHQARQHLRDPSYVVGHLARLVGNFAPYRRGPAVRQLTAQAAGLLTAH